MTLPIEHTELTKDHIQKAVSVDLITIGQLSDLTGLHYNTVSNHKNGIRPISNKHKKLYFNVLKDVFIP